jgi:hypothetical protein
MGCKLGREPVGTENAATKYTVEKAEAPAALHPPVEVKNKGSVDPYTNIGDFKPSAGGENKSDTRDEDDNEDDQDGVPKAEGLFTYIFSSNEPSNNLMNFFSTALPLTPYQTLYSFTHITPTKLSYTLT